jgi:hypothetical protein
MTVNGNTKPFIIAKYIKYIESQDINDVLNTTDDEQNWRLAQTFDYIDTKKLTNDQKEVFSYVKQIIGSLFLGYQVCKRDDDANDTILADSPLKRIGKKNYPEEGCARIQMRPMIAANIILTRPKDAKKEETDQSTRESQIKELETKRIQTVIVGLNDLFSNKTENTYDFLRKLLNIIKTTMYYYRDCLQTVIIYTDTENETKNKAKELKSKINEAGININFIVSNSDNLLGSNDTNNDNNSNTFDFKKVLSFFKSSNPQDKQISVIEKSIPEYFSLVKSIKQEANELLETKLNSLHNPIPTLQSAVGGKMPRKKSTKKPSPYQKTPYKHTDKHGVVRVVYTKGVGKYVRVMDKKKNKMVYRKIG